ncbi:asparagine synthase (glutamine-hydrolyzing) [bacterium]|nr:asparagine synthase (glutamine-hydrolyzing) [bacterium]
MCGIAGIVSLGTPISEDDRRDIRRMTELLRHRGPDTTGYFENEDVCFGNTRLSIIDLSDNAGLPMTNDDRGVCVTYNGEVTNFREIADEFALGEKYPFHSTSDTEVFLHLYEELGVEALSRLSGMFALGLYDKARRKVFVVRDFYGIRPLFHMTAGDRLYFASEIKCFMDLPRFDGTLDNEAVFHFLSLAYMPDVHTPWAQVRELQGSNLIEIDLAEKRQTLRPYYEIRYAPDESLTEADVRPELHARMRDSVRRNLISDAPLGLTLSGGFDTSSILALCRELGVNREVHTYSIVMDEPSFDESHYQKIMVDFARPIHHEIRVGPQDVAKTLVRHMAFLDEPNGDGAAIPSFLLAEHAREHVRVLLSGEGGDEIFNAYETHMAFKARKLYRRYVPGPIRMLARKTAHALPVSMEKLSFDFVAKRFTTGAEMSAPEAHLYWRHVLTDEDKLRLMPGSEAYRPTHAFFSDIFDASDFKYGLDKISLVDIRQYFIGDLMVKNDRMMMAHSIEARFPWMDRLLLEYVSTIPPHLRMKGFTRRYVQKQAMKGSVPRRIYRRQNMGLEMPHSIWFFHGLKPVVDRYFTKKNVERFGIFSWPVLKELLDDHWAKKKDNGRALWCILMYMIWFDLFVENKDFKDYLA